MSELVAWTAVVLALGLLGGGWISRRGFHRGVRELEAYLRGWEEGKREGEEHARAPRRSRGQPAVLKPIFEKLEEHRETFLNLQSFSKATTRRLQKLIDVLSEAVLLYDSDGQLLFANGKMRELAGLAKEGEQAGEGEPEAALGRVAEFVRSSLDVGTFAEDCFRAGEELAGREVALRVGEEERRFFATPHLVRSRTNATPPSLLIFLTDMEEAEELRRDAERRVELEHIHLASELMAHRVRNPLNSIVLVLELMRRERAADPRQQKNLETIQGEVGRLEATLERFLAMMRRRGRRTDSVDLVAVVEAVSELLYPLAWDGGVKIRQELQVPSARVRGDEVEILRAALGPALAAVRAAAQGAGVNFRLDSDRREHLLFIESESVPAGSIELAVAEDLAARNGGSLTYDDPGRPTRLTYRYRAESGID